MRRIDSARQVWYFCYKIHHTSVVPQEQQTTRAMKHLKFVYIFIIVCVVRGEFCAPPSPFLAAFRGPFNIDVKCIWIASGQQLNFRLALNSQSIEYWAASCHTSPYFLLYQNNVCFHSAAARQGIINRTSYVGRLEMCNIL